MLLCVKQMSSERAAASLSHWQTPRELYEWVRDKRLEAEAEEDADAAATAAGPQQKGRKKVRGVELVFADTVQGEGRQKIGDQLSRDVGHVPACSSESAIPITDHRSL
jgi:crossover junction endonuclease MUS81